MADDSWLTLIGNILIEADKYLDHLKAQNPSPPTEPAHSDPPKKPWQCKYCGEPIIKVTSRLYPREDETYPCWIHTKTDVRYCTLLATPSG